MRNFRLLIYAALAITLALLGTVAVFQIFVFGEAPGFFVGGFCALLAAAAVFSAVSIAAIGRGRGESVKRLWLFLSALFFFYLAADFAGGLVFIRPVPFQNFPDEHVHHKMPPGTRYELSDPDSGAVYVTLTNNLGFRGEDISEKEPGAYRIVVTGDSFTLGYGVGDDTFPLLLERLLNKEGNGKYEVINLGVVSYAPVLEYLLLKKHIGELKPDMVVLNFDMSDPVQEYAYRKIANFGETGDIAAVDGYPGYYERRHHAYETILNWLRNHMFITGSIIESRENKSRIVDVWDINVANTVERANRMLLMHTLDAPQLKESAEMHAMVEDSILRAKRLCDTHGCKFILSVYPWGHQVNGREWMPGRYDFILRDAGISDRTVEELGRFARENGITFFDAFPVFRAYEGGERLYFTKDPHWTPAGQRLMAESLAGFIEEDLKKGD